MNETFQSFVLFPQVSEPSMNFNYIENGLFSHVIQTFNSHKQFKLSIQIDNHHNSPSIPCGPGGYWL